MLKTRILEPVIKDLNSVKVFKNLKIEYIKSSVDKSYKYIKFTNGKKDDFESSSTLFLNLKNT